MSGTTPATVRFYIDADILGLGKLLAGLRSDVTHPGDPGATIKRRSRPACVVTTPATLDSDWIPIVSQQGLVIITRDRSIQRHPAEVGAVVANVGKMVALSGPDAVTTWDQLEVVMCQWRRIEALVDLPGPFVYTATRTSLVKVV
ncbi:MAG: hypothetical protein QOE07_41 [Acidimicrobiaceae bacterium]|jgi:hypothetical protein|nr:hypothetical protein [Acidimicrobiaceae bacterium]MDQ1411453.1 hypothetical protein [Acidimicrobiaceae bacterium]